MSDGERVQDILNIKDKVSGATEQPIRRRLDKLGNSPEEGVWSEEYGTLREDLEPFTRAATSELIQAITERVREQRLFTEEEVELAARRFDYHATGVLEFAQVKKIRQQMADDGESFDIDAAIASVTSLDESDDAFVPRLPGKNPLTLREAIEQNINLEFDEKHSLGLFDPLSKDEPEYIDTGQDPLNPTHWGDTEEDRGLLSDQRRLVGAGLLRYNETELAEDFDKQADLYTSGDFIREALYATNARLLQEKIARGVEAKLTPEQITAQLQKEYPEYEDDFGNIVQEVQKAMDGGEGIGTWGMYRKILALYGRDHKVSLAKIAALSAASSAGELGAGVLVPKGLLTKNPWLVAGGAAAMMGAHIARTFQAHKTESLVRELSQGKEGFEGTVLEVTRQVVQAQPDIVSINRAGFSSSPRALEIQTHRLQKILSSIPAELIPALINSLVSGIYLTQSSPEGEQLAAILVNTGWHSGAMALQMKAESAIERSRQAATVATHNTRADLMGAGGEGYVDSLHVQDVLDAERSLASRESSMRRNYRLPQVGPRGVALLLNSTLYALGIEGVNLDEVVAQSSAQAQIAEAAVGTGASIMRTTPQLRALAEFYNSIMLQDSQIGKEIPTSNDIRLVGIQRVDAKGNKYFDAEQVNIQQGEKYQLVGSPGGGKSTFYEVLYGEGADGGLMTVGGFRFGEVDKRAYRESIGIKPQAVDTIEGSLAANLAGLRFDQDRLLAGQVLAGSHRFREMYQKYQANEPDNYKLSYDDLNAETKAHVAAEILEKERVVSTFVRSQETGLSGGQRQLLGLWRIKFQIEFAKKHQGEQGVQRVRTILLDEPLKELSGELRKEAEALILEWLDDEELTVIMSNHETLPPDSVLGQRLSTLHKIQAENGKVTNIG